MPPRPGVCKVIDSIKAELANEPGFLLPGRAVLARRLSVGESTVSLAIAQLKREGVIAGVKGQRCRVPRPADHGNLRMPGGSIRAWDSVAENIRKDLAQGIYKPGISLPTGKELRVRYRTSPVTLRKALKALAAEDLLVQQGRHFIAPSVALPAGRTHVLFVWFSDVPFLPSHDSDTTFIRTLERECLRNSVALEKLLAIIGPDRRINLHRHEDTVPAGPELLDMCAGIVYLVSWWGCVNETVFDWLAHCGKPVSIIDWLGDWELPSSLASRPRVQLIRSSVTKKPGFDAGKFLTGLGHRKIAYFSPYGLSWPRIRLQGIAKACALAGAPHVVIPFIQKDIPEEQEFQRLTRERETPIETIVRSTPGIPAGYTAARQYFGAMAWLVYSNAVYYSLLEPLFEKALAQSEITAWVGCNDTVAMMTWSFLRSKGVRIPADISLMGFGNLLEAIQSDITSYEYNYEAASAAALNFILRPGFVSRIRKLARPEIEGFIIERGSTGKPPMHR
jgi:DNA-binding LacI/PurR family transcriptional regulator